MRHTSAAFRTPYFRSKDHPWEHGGEGGITWRAIALGENGEALGSDEIGW